MKHTRLTYYLSIAAACLCMLSCGDDEAAPVVEELDAPVVTISKVTADSIVFGWVAVPGARQYGYRVTDSNGTDADAGVTTDTSVELAKLDSCTLYSIVVTSFPEELGAALYKESARKDVQTLIKTEETAYTSHLQANNPTVTNKGQISESRDFEGYEDDWYGIITIEKFCGANGRDLVFTVNRDKTINILNGERLQDEAGADTRTVCVVTGKSSSATLSFDKIYIDESSAVFDGQASTLTFSARNNGVGARLRESTTEIIKW